jgi:hypothetical protein
LLIRSTARATLSYCEINSFNFQTSDYDAFLYSNSASSEIILSSCTFHDITSLRPSCIITSTGGEYFLSVSDSIFEDMESPLGTFDFYSGLKIELFKNNNFVGCYATGGHGGGALHTFSFFLFFFFFFFLFFFLFFNYVNFAFFFFFFLYQIEILQIRLKLMDAVLKTFMLTMEKDEPFMAQ